MKKFLTLLSLTVALMGLGAGAASAKSTLPPCEFEDSINCVWNAAERGNGEGRSFTNIDGVVHYWDARTVTPVEGEPCDLPDGVTGSWRYAGAPGELVCFGGRESGMLPTTPGTPLDPVPPVVEVPVTTAPVPVPEIVQPETVPQTMPEGTEERVATGQELAYTGAGESALLGGIAASILSAGAGLVYLSRRLRRA